ncbi:MAG TPA: hypothetical protein VH370_20530 [Humisphaera sp.]|jgi:predicted site-specific integrase-resolvase|nr:hypothetical protein [Humisphaera sp.]
MDDVQAVNRAAEITGVARGTISRWLKSGKLKGKKTTVGNLVATLVSVAAVRKLKASQPRGRPRKS